MNILSTIKKYKNLVTSKYIFISSDEIDVITKGEYWLSKKFDGQLWFYYKQNKISKIINSNQKSQNIFNKSKHAKKRLGKKGLYPNFPK